VCERERARRLSFLMLSGVPILSLVCALLVLVAPPSSNAQALSPRTVRTAFSPFFIDMQPWSQPGMTWPTPTLKEKGCCPGSLVL